MGTFARVLRRSAPLLLAYASGCASRATYTLPPAAAARPTAAAPVAPATPRPVEAPAPAPALYTLDEALADASSGPLQLVGVGPWSGLFLKLVCVYRNDRVFVVDHRCGKTESNTMDLTIHSPTRGFFGVHAEAKGPVSPLRREEYQSFTMSFSPPGPRLAPIDLSMTYEQFEAAHEASEKKFPPRCDFHASQPEARCDRSLPGLAPAFTAAHAQALRSPPEAYYSLLRGVIGLRPKTFASLKPGTFPPTRLGAWVAAWSAEAGVTVHLDALALVGNAEGRAAPVVLLPDGGFLVASLRQTTHHGGPGDVQEPVATRFDASGTKLWERAIPAKGYQEAERATALALPDGFAVTLATFPNPAALPVYRVIKLDPRGAVVWSWAMPAAPGRLPQVESMRLAPSGAIALSGHLQLLPDEKVLLWKGELDAKGKLVNEEVGPEQPRPQRAH